MEAKRRRGEPQQQGEKGPVASDGAISLDALDCIICYRPLRPPVLQCTVGHVICLSCHNKLLDKNKCHLCAITGGYNRCVAFDHILESIKAPCSNSIYGCTVKTRYHKREDHEKSCPQAPCFCPEAGCGFAGSTAQVLHHLTSDHMLPATEFTYGWRFTLQMQENMWVLHTKDEGGPLFLVKFTPVPPFGNAVSILFVDPHAVPGECKFECHVDFYCGTMGWQQRSNFQIISSTLSNGFPAEEGSYSFVVPTVSPNPRATSSSLTIRLQKLIRP